ncbi:MAG: cupin [Phycisphaeraceae bacterium]|nr:cupin [Phycisphaeraceae bacterium]
MSFAAREKDAEWRRDGLRPYFVYRDLGIRDATGGKVLAHIIRAAKPCKGPMGYHSHQLEFQMVYMIKGWALIDFEDVGRIRVEAGDVWYQAPSVRHEVLEYSDDWEVMEITMPADFETRDEQR